MLNEGGKDGWKGGDGLGAERDRTKCEWEKGGFIEKRGVDKYPNLSVACTVQTDGSSTA